jgi:5-oxopent-3-ene-1,2,5-tricarboxylate decarboxylase / 2-hydroxyhepta-2,4-diene-1,7-dioate isomerase
MSVLDGPRREMRRILYEGSVYWVTAREEGRLELADGRSVSEKEVRHLPPCMPSKILCTHINYRSRWHEQGRTTPPEAPTYFQKPVSALNGHGGELVRPQGCKYLNYEGELAAIIGRVSRNLRPEEVWDHLAGFAVANDVGLHDMRDTDAGSMLRVKGPDGFCPIGPGIVAGVDPRRSTLRSFRNGRLVQEGRLAEEMFFGIDYLVADLARLITLEPGDVILTGTPANSRPMQPGDLIEVEITGIGRLANRVVEAPAPRARIGHQPTDSDNVRRTALGNDERLPPLLRQR